MNRSKSLLRATGCAHPRKPAAFTLIELMVALALAGILAATTAPNWRAFLATSELRDRSEALARALSVARSEAIKRGTRVDLCPSAAAGITIAVNRPVADYISFTSLGHARRHDGALQMGTFTICRRGQDARKVVLANSGRVRTDVTHEACP